MTRSITRALMQLGDAAFLGILLRALAITIAAEAGLVALAWWAVTKLPQFETAWLALLATWLLRIGALAGGLLLFVPIASSVIAFFLDAVAGAVERRYYPDDPPARPQSFWDSLVAALRFTLVIVAANVLALPLYLIPGGNLVVFVGLNGYLLGREYFELVAARRMSTRDAERLRRAVRGRVLLAGMVIALLLLVPVVNLLAPLLGTALMVHEFKAIQRIRGQV